MSKCPNCSEGELVVRRNSHTGAQFIGCSNFPQCRYSADMPGTRTPGRQSHQPHQSRRARLGEAGEAGDEATDAGYVPDYYDLCME